MANKSIEGNRGKIAEGGGHGLPPEPGPAPAAPRPERMGVLKQEEGRLYVESGGERIRIDDRSVARLIGQRSTPLKSPARAAVTPAVPKELGPAIEAARKYRADLEKYPGVVSVRAGYKFIKGRITSVPSIVVAVERKREKDQIPSRDRLPESLGGVAVDVTPADPYELLAHRRRTGEESAPRVRTPLLLIDQLQSGEEGAEALEIARTITYKPPDGATLPEVREAMTVLCHVSPDAGFRVLEPFLKAAERTIHLGMYDFTAPHIFRTARSLLRDSVVEWQMTLGPNESLPGADEPDSNKAEDLHEEDIIKGLRKVAGDRFESAFAHVGAGKTFASAYHIKVAVRDSKSFWLSSGNWQSSNQPAIDFLAPDADRQLIPTFNREWHVVVDHPGLSKIFRTYLKGDLQTASEPEESARVPEAGPELLVPLEEALFEERASTALQVFAPKKFVFTNSNPLRVQPILTPDNYSEVVLDFLRRRPKKTLYFQNQSLNPVLKPTDEFAELMQLMIDYTNDEALDVRIIFRNIGPMRKKLESLKAAGFNMDRIRMQSGCHTKGIIVDSEVVMVGSHNFTNDGTQFNRDASLLMHDSGIAKYYEDIFLHDWDRLARPTIREESAPRLASGEESASDNFVRLSWPAYSEED